MAINVSLNQLSTLNNTSILQQSNTNFNTIQNALPDALSRSGQTPNQMLSNLDMNSNQILNLPSPASINSPARLIDVVSNPTITVPPLGTSGAVVGLLNANKTDSGNNTFSGTNTFTTAPVFPNNSLTNIELAQAPANTLKGNLTGGTANITDNTLTAVEAALPFTQTGAGAVLRTVDAKIKDNTINVRDFGAVGNGVHDDTSAIQTAIAAMLGDNTTLIKNPCSLYFPAGNYLVTSSLSITSALFYNIFGDGPYASTISFQPGSLSNLFNISFGGGFGGGPVWISNLLFIGLNANANSALNVNNVQDLMISDCWFKSVLTGMVLNQSYAPYVRGCIFQSCGNWGIAAVDNSGAGCSIIQNHFFGCGLTGGGAGIGLNTSLSGLGSSGVYIAGNDFEGNNGGIQFWQTGPAVIFGNDFDHGNNYHWFIAGGNNGPITVMGNYFGTCGTTQIANVQGVRFENNTLFNYSQTWASTATQVKQGYNAFTGTGSLGNSANTFSTLPGANASHSGELFEITDSTTATLGATISGGGANKVLAHCNGTNWTVAAI